MKVALILITIMSNMIRILYLGNTVAATATTTTTTTTTTTATAIT